MRIKKLSGQEEEFNRTKLLNSIRWAGVSDQIASEVTAKVVPHEGMNTSEIRSQVVAALLQQDSAAAQRYERTRVRKARIAPDVSKDVARLHPETLRALQVGTGSLLRLQHAGHTQDIRAEASPNVALDGIRMHTETLRSLGASVESKVALSRAWA